MISKVMSWRWLGEKSRNTVTSEVFSTQLQTRTFEDAGLILQLQPTHDHPNREHMNRRRRDCEQKGVRQGDRLVPGTMDRVLGHPRPTCAVGCDSDRRRGEDAAQGAEAVDQDRSMTGWVSRAAAFSRACLIIESAILIRAASPGDAINQAANYRESPSRGRPGSG